MSLTLVSSEPCWGLRGFDGDGEPITYHFAGGREAALKEATDRLKYWEDALPIAPEQETQMCWRADCDGCGWEFEEDEIGAGAHIPGDRWGPERGALDDYLFEQPDGRLLCPGCNLEALGAVELSASHPKAQIPGQGELLGVAK